MLEAIERGLVRSCHDVGEGGLLAAIFETLLEEEGPTGRGVALELGDLPLAPIEAMLTEDGGFLFEVAPDSVAACLDCLEQHGIAPQRIGRVLDERRIIARS